MHNNSLQPFPSVETINNRNRKKFRSVTLKLLGRRRDCIEITRNLSPAKLASTQELVANEGLHSNIPQKPSALVSENQVVCLLSYPGFNFSCDYGRVMISKKQEIFVNVVSDDGSSGGGLFNADGYLVGILSRSYDKHKYSSVEPIRDICSILKKLMRTN